MFLKRFLGVAVLIFSSIASVNAEEKQMEVAIVVEGQSELEVYFSRAIINNAGGAVAGLIGAGIQSAVEADQDRDLHDQLAPRIDSSHWQDHFIDTLNERLFAKNFAAHWAPSSEPVKHGVILELHPDEHGYRVVETTTMFMSAFVEFEYRIYDAGTARSRRPELERVYVTHKDHRAKETYLQDDTILNQDLIEALNKGARRVANKIIYRKR